MYISCNQLKKYIAKSDEIDFMKVAKDFTIKSAEVDSLEVKGDNIQNVIVAEVKSLTTHPENSKYKVAVLDIGNSKEITVVTSATNLYVGMKAPCALEGGSLLGVPKVSKAALGGVTSEGVLASEKELGISDNHLGVMDLDKGYEVGKNIKDILPIEDIIIEIDNKSLTNRPDMWGYYGIAREVAAITGHELLELPVEKILNDKAKEIKIDIKDKENCNRYSALEISNVTKKETDIDMKIMLYYSGMRSISLLVDLTNYLMLELGQPMHAFDSNKIDEIVVKNTNKEEIEFTTLDGVKRKLPQNTLVICNNEIPVAIAGIMGGLDTEVEGSTTSIVLESANFDGTCLRRSATKMGLRTEAVARYEKKLDPNMTVKAIERFVWLLKKQDENVEITSNLADVYVNKLESKKVILKKEYLHKYMGAEIDSSEITKILKSLMFEVTETEDAFEVLAPTYRSTKDISNPADVIEEIARIHGYNNLKPEPLKLDLVIKHSDGRYKMEYNLKKKVAEKARLNEVHTYLWYELEYLAKLGINKSNNITVINKKDNNILRDDLSLSLLERCFENSKHTQEYGIFEIGSEMREKEERHLAILSVCTDNNAQKVYMEMKQLAYEILKEYKNTDVKFEKAESTKEYIDEGYALDILMDEKVVGYIALVKKEISILCSKKTSIVNVQINLDKLIEVKSGEILDKEISKFPVTFLDYTIITDKNDNYYNIEKVLETFKHKYLLGYYLYDIYIDDSKKTTIRFEIGADERTLTREDITELQDMLASHIQANGFRVVGK